MPKPILIAQISDLHIKPPGELAYGRVDTAAALTRCIATLNELAPQPDLVVVSGDLTDTAKPEEYAHLIRPRPPPPPPPPALTRVHLGGGEPLRAAFPSQPYAMPAGALNFALGVGELDVVLVDSSVPSQPHGELDRDTLDWLDRTLAASTTRP